MTYETQTVRQAILWNFDLVSTIWHFFSFGIRSKFYAIQLHRYSSYAYVYNKKDGASLESIYLQDKSGKITL